MEKKNNFLEYGEKKKLRVWREKFFMEYGEKKFLVWKENFFYGVWRVKKKYFLAWREEIFS